MPATLSYLDHPPLLCQRASRLSGASHGISPHPRLTRSHGRDYPSRPSPRWVLLPKPPNPLTHLTTLTLRSLHTELGGLGIRRYSGLAGETACLRGRTVFYEFAEQFAPESGAMEDVWSPIVLGAASDGVRGSVQG